MGNILRFSVVLTTLLFIHTATLCSVSTDCAVDAHCDNGKCRCNEGFVGLGNYLCESEATSCPCISYGDPHVYTFERGNINYVFPCTHALARYSTDTCGPVLVYGTSVRRGDGITEEFESQVFWFIQKDTTSYSGYITPQGILMEEDTPTSPLPTTLGTSSFSVTLYQDNRGYFIVAAPDCHTHIGFHRSGVITIASPRGHTSLGYGACGVCGDGGETLEEWGQAAFGSTSLTVRQKKAVQLASELESTMDTNSLCGNISVATAACGTAKDIALAAEACVDLVDNKGIFRQCLWSSGMADKALWALASCVTAHCDGDTNQACKVKADFGLQCSPVVTLNCET